MIPITYTNYVDYSKELKSIYEQFPHLKGCVEIKVRGEECQVRYVDSPAYFRIGLPRDRCYLILTEDRSINISFGDHAGTGEITTEYENYEHPDGTPNPYALTPNTALLTEEEMVTFRARLRELIMHSELPGIVVTE